MNTSTSPDTEASNSPASTKRTLWLLIFTFLIWLPLMTLLRAWVIVLLWRWFVVPQFETAPLSWPIAAGFSVLFDFLTGANKQALKPIETVKETSKPIGWAEKTILSSFGTGLLQIGITLLFGLIIHLFV